MILLTWSGLSGMNGRFSTRSMLGRKSIELTVVYGVIGRRHTGRQLPDHLADFKPRQRRDFDTLRSEQRGKSAKGFKLFLTF